MGAFARAMDRLAEWVRWLAEAVRLLKPRQSPQNAQDVLEAFLNDVPVDERTEDELRAEGVPVDDIKDTEEREHGLGSETVGAPAEGAETVVGEEGAGPEGDVRADSEPVGADVGGDVGSGDVGRGAEPAQGVKREETREERLERRKRQRREANEMRERMNRLMKKNRKYGGRRKPVANEENLLPRDNGNVYNISERFATNQFVANEQGGTDNRENAEMAESEVGYGEALVAGIAKNETSRERRGMGLQAAGARWATSYLSGGKRTDDARVEDFERFGFASFDTLDRMVEGAGETGGATHLNALYDAFVTFCQNLDIPYDVISLGGQLQLKAKNISRKEREMSKPNIAIEGSGPERNGPPFSATIYLNSTIEDTLEDFAHEWAHAFDYLVSGGRHLNISSLSVDEATALRNNPLSRRNKTNARKAVVEAFNSLMTEIHSSEFYDRAKAKDDEDKSKPRYWSRPDELFARAFEAYFKNVSSNGDLAYGRDVADAAMLPYLEDKSTQTIFRAIDKLFRTMRNGPNHSTGRRTLYSSEGPGSLPRMDVGPTPETYVDAPTDGVSYSGVKFSTEKPGDERLSATVRSVREALRRDGDKAVELLGGTILSNYVREETDAALRKRVARAAVEKLFNVVPVSEERLRQAGLIEETLALPEDEDEVASEYEDAKIVDARNRLAHGGVLVGESQAEAVVRARAKQVLGKTFRYLFEVYHGTPHAGWTRWERGHGGTTGLGYAYFAPRVITAAEYADTSEAPNKGLADVKDMQRYGLSEAVYHMVVGMNNPLIVDCRRASWNNIRMKNKRTVRTDEILNVARFGELGYDGVIFLNVHDSQLSVKLHGYDVDVDLTE